MKIIQNKSKEDKIYFDKLIKGRNTPQKVVLRAKIINSFTKGKLKTEISKELNTSRPTIDLWINRYKKEGVTSILRDATRTGRKVKISSSKEETIIKKTLHSKPKGSTHWSTRLMSEATGVSRMTVQRIWKKYNIKPHLIKKFKISNDPNFVEKVKDIIGLYLNPPEKALVLCVDEKTQIQALDRTQPGLPMKRGKLETMTHDYKRYGTTSLFAALNMLDGKVIGDCMLRHSHKEFLIFLNKINNQTPKDFDIHLILDNYGTHKTEEIKKWLSKNPRFKTHFTPTSCSWLNMVERFFSKITTKMIRRGNFRSVKDLENSIMAFLKFHNQNPKVYKWIKDADTIISKVNICKEVLGTLH